MKARQTPAWLSDSTFFFTVKEHCLQLLFPRACPVCGELLKLPPKWCPDLIRPVPDRNHFRRDTDRYRSIMICSRCLPALTYVEEPVCIQCSRPLFSEEDLYCDICKRSPRYFDSGAALWIHDDTARKIIYDLKFQNKRDNAELIGFETALHKKERIELWNAEALLPVPLHKKRFRERGFNQAQLIAEKISFWFEKLYGIRIPVNSEYLLRTENTKPQRILDAASRTRNVRNAFTAVIPSPPAGSDSSSRSPFPKDSRPLLSVNDRFPGNTLPHYRTVVLVDDIFTSGSTLNACARTLKEAGCEKVYFLTASIV